MVVGTVRRLNYQTSKILLATHVLLPREEAVITLFGFNESLLHQDSAGHTWTCQDQS